MYDLPCNDALNECKVSLESLAMIYVAADKYLVTSLKEKVYRKIQRHRNCQNLTDVEDFVKALEVIITGTTPNDNDARTAMVDACVKHIDLLRQKPGFSAMLRKYGDIGAEIIYHNRLAPMIEGTWFCGVTEHAEAVPSCSKCSRPFPESYVRGHRHLKTWVCPTCDQRGYPVCEGGFGSGHLGCRNVKWQWRLCTEEEMLLR